MNQEIKEQIADVLKKYPDFEVKEEAASCTLSGKFIMNAEYNNIPLYDEYEIEIVVRDIFPDEVPEVRNLGNDIPTAFEHFYSNGALCLGAACELYDFLAEKKSLRSFIDEIVMSYFYAVSYYRRYGTVPYGERSHGIKGIEEAYMDRYEVADQNVLIQLMMYLAGVYRYRGHIDCPCGSGMRFRDCHGQKILRDIMSPINRVYRADAYQVLVAYIEQRER